MSAANTQEAPQLGERIASRVTPELRTWRILAPGARRSRRTAPGLASRPPGRAGRPAALSMGLIVLRLIVLPTVGGSHKLLTR